MDTGDDADDWYYPGPDQEPPATAGETLQAVLNNFGAAFAAVAARVIEQLAPPPATIRRVAEVTLGHHSVCNHKVPCKPPGPGAAFNAPATKQKRSRRTVARA